MIERYSRPEMAHIWTAENRFRIWLEIETLACEAQAELGVIPKEVVPVIRAKGNFDIDRIDAIEAEVKHDVIAFLDLGRRICRTRGAFYPSGDDLFRRPRYLPVGADGPGRR